MVLSFELFGISLGNTSSVSFKCSLISNVVFWIASFLGLYADHLVATQKSPLLSRCKLQPKQSIISRNDKNDLIALSSFNMIFVALCICCPLYEWAWSRIQAERRLTQFDDWTSIWMSELFIKLPIHALVAEAAFYSFHGLLHYSPTLYRHIHKVRTQSVNMHRV